MSRTVTVAATQMACSWDREANIANAEKLVREAAAKGAQVILIQELFETPYFCQKPNPEYLQLATSVEDNPAVQHCQKVAPELQLVLPVSFFELPGPARFNSIAIIDADGKDLGNYRKTHIHSRSTASGRSSTSGPATWATPYSTPPSPRSAPTSATTVTFPRSEERRVGKECRARGSREH